MSRGIRRSVRRRISRGASHACHPLRSLLVFAVDVCATSELAEITGIYISFGRWLKPHFSHAGPRWASALATGGTVALVGPASGNLLCFNMGIREESDSRGKRVGYAFSHQPISNGCHFAVVCHPSLPVAAGWFGEMAHRPSIKYGRLAPECSP